MKVAGEWVGVIKTHDRSPGGICSKVVACAGHGSHLPRCIAPGHRGDADHGSQGQAKLAREDVVILPPFLLDEAAAEYAGPAIEVLGRRFDQSLNEMIFLIMIYAQMELGVGQGYRKHGGR